MTRRGLLAYALLLAAVSVTRHPPAAAAAALDLPALAGQARALGVPLLLFFTTPGCPYCAEVRASYLAPRLAAAPPQLRVGEIDITSAARVTDFDGRAVREADLAARYGVRMVPVVLAVDARGAALGAPLVGLDRAGFYDGLLQALIDGARAVR